MVVETDALIPTLDGACYTDPGILSAEFERIFERQWYYVGREDEIPSSGRFIRRRVGRETVVLVRGKDQVIRGFLNVCRHRGAQLCLTDGGEVGRTIRQAARITPGLTDSTASLSRRPTGGRLTVSIAAGIGCIRCRSRPGKG